MGDPQFGWLDRRNIDRVRNSTRTDQMELALQGIQNRSCCIRLNWTIDRELGIQARKMVPLVGRTVEAQWVENKMAAMVLGKTAQKMASNLVVMEANMMEDRTREDRKMVVNMTEDRTRVDRKTVKLERDKMALKVERKTVWMVVNKLVGSKPEVTAERKTALNKSE